MKFAFVTCVQLGLSCIEKIYKIGGKLDLLITLNDNKAVHKSGRIYLDSFSEKNGVPLLKINHINDEIAINTIKDKGIDWLFIIGWSQIANEDVIAAPKLGTLGMHPTLLPKGRGRASIPWAIIKGLSYTGVTMFRIDKGVDSGDILCQKKVEIVSTDNACSLYSKVNEAHEVIMEKVFPLLVDNKVNFVKQNETQVTYWEGRKPEDGLITFDMNINYVERMVRALTRPYPGAFIIENEKKIIIWKAHVSLNRSLETECRHFEGGYLVFDEFEILK